MPDNPLPRFLNVEELSEVLHLHPVTVQEMAREKRVPAFKVGRHWLFDLDEVLAALGKKEGASDE